MNERESDNLIRKHYREQAAKHGDSMFSTMPDEIVRTREVTAINDFITAISSKFKKRKLNILDLGCGNGYTLEMLSPKFPHHNYFGLDFSPELLAIAKKRRLPKIKFIQGDARDLDFPDSFFDVVYTERCLINILNWKGQERALLEIHRALKKDCYYLMIECFTDGLENYNRAREELGIEPLKETYHNKYLEKPSFLKSIKNKFKIVNPEEIAKENPLLQPNFLSSHYFVARVVYPALTTKEVVYNTQFVKFFSFLPPIGNYSPIQLYILKKI